jgi:uncharacterized protein (DUF1015 family)
MAQIQPFPGIRAQKDKANAVIAPPYDVLSETEARAIAKAKPQSFIHVTRPEVALPEGSDSHSAEAYAMARKQLTRLLETGALVQEKSACFYLYSQRMGDHEQHGLMATCAVAEYDAGQIKKHEYTRPDKEQDRVNHIQATQAQTGLVFLIHKKTTALSALRTAALTLPVLFEVTTDDGVVHGLRRIDAAEHISAWQAAFGELDALYIADGHHRSAAASRVSESKNGEGASAYFLAGIFPEDALQVLPYNRLIADLNGRDSTAFLTEVSKSFILTMTDAPTPPERGLVHMYIDQNWYRLQHRKPRSSDPVDCLDVAVLQDHLLSPLLGIRDPRRDTRIQFVGGIRGTQVLEEAVNQGRAAVAFSLFPTGLDQLLAVADADQVMPPKSTWFEPKLAGGIVLHALD